MQSRTLIVSTMAIVPGKVRRAAMAAQDVAATINPLITHGSLLKGAPFSCISLVLVFGREDADTPTYKEIGEEGELPLAIELDMVKLQRATGSELRDRFLFSTLCALMHTGKKYGLDTEGIERLLQEPTSGAGDKIDTRPREN